MSVSLSVLILVQGRCMLTADEQGFVQGVAIAYCLLGTAAGFCFVVDVKNCCLVLFVELELKLNSDLLLIDCSSSHTCTKPHVSGSIGLHGGCWAFTVCLWLVLGSLFVKVGFAFLPCVPLQRG